MTPLIGIVTVLYNSEAVLPDFFASLNDQSYQPIVLYVVDNHSPDCALAVSSRLAETSRFRTVVIANSENYGVAKGNNIGIQRALGDGCDLVLLSNNDVTLEKDTIEKLLDGLIAHQADLAAPKIYYAGTKQFWCAGGSFHKRSGLNLHRGLHQPDTGQYQRDELMTFAPTCFLLIRRDVFEKVGLMDERYFVYWDDTDFVYRAVMKQHQTLWYIPASVVHHKEGTSTGVLSDFSIRFQYRNLVYFALKNYSRPYAEYVIVYNIALHIVRNLFRWPMAKWML
ncbi:MAG: glycosyltransferase family 2 protein [Bacteroidota bacterium]|nr:glycosyltransferase family 2 protein [Bacteroidota bacterium]